MNLNEQITACVVGSGRDDYDQRSAIGMARSWVDNREPIRRQPDQIEYPKRDQLAKDLVAIFEANPATDAEYIEALQAARRVVNAPFQGGCRDGDRKALAKPKEQKKAREAAAR